MKEPICIICGSREGCDVVDFRRTPEGEEFRKSGKKGHDPDCDWFCIAHLAVANAFSHLTISEAVAAIKGY
ncbi:MAG TPA: hypothetical protein VLD37_03685 [Candidatus Bilamarchaeum sp.]|nr:hypothetical protein [Candidatus Bilamarchaeum sp.]